MKALLAAALIGLASPALAAGPLTVRTGESWSFTLDHGQPAKARRVASSVKPKRGEIMVSVSALMGTTMTISSNNAVGYTFSATLVGTEGKPVAARTCTLPANGRTALENWPQKSAAVRLSDFKPTSDPGRC